MEIREFILSYIRDGNEIIDSKFDMENDKNESIDFENMDEISKEIAKLIDDQIKPAVASDHIQNQNNSQMPITQTTRAL